MCGLLFLNIKLEHTANKSAMWHLCWWEGQTKVNQTLVFWNCLTIKTKQIKTKQTIICTWTKRPKHSQFEAYAKRRGQGETSGKVAEGWSLKRAGANRRAWWPGVDTNSTRWNEERRRNEAAVEEALTGRHVLAPHSTEHSSSRPLGPRRAGWRLIALHLEVKHVAKPNHRETQELFPQTQHCPGSHNSSKSPRKLSSSTKFQAKLDNFKRFPAYSIRQYSFHHPFLFPTGVGEGVIIYSLARQTRSHIAAAPLTELRTSNFGP